MSYKIQAQPTPETPADYEAVLDQYLAEIQILNEKMVADQEAIEHLQAETDVLKAETERLRVETRAILDRLEALV